MIECLECGWFGDPSELVAKTNGIDDRDFDYCPDCESKDIEEAEDLEED